MAMTLKTKCGPYGEEYTAADGTVKRRVTTEGQQLIETFLGQFDGNPGKLLTGIKSYRALLSVAKRVGLKWREINNICAMAATKAMTTFNPEKAKFATYAAYQMYCTLQHAIDLERPEKPCASTICHYKSEGKVIPHIPEVILFSAYDRPNDGGRTKNIFEATYLTYTPAQDYDGDMYDALDAILDEVVTCERQRKIFRKITGIGEERVPQSVCGRSFGISKTRVQQIHADVAKRIREPLLAALGRDK